MLPNAHFPLVSGILNQVQAFLDRGGRFCLSDDSHGVEQIGLNYHQVIEFLEKAGIDILYRLQMSDKPLKEPPFPRFPRTEVIGVSIEEIKRQAPSP